MEFVALYTAAFMEFVHCRFARGPSAVRTSLAKGAVKSMSNKGSNSGEKSPMTERRRPSGEPRKRPRPGLVLVDPVTTVAA